MSETAPFRPIVGRTASRPTIRRRTAARICAIRSSRCCGSPSTVTETTGPASRPAGFAAMADLSVMNGKQALGERIIVRGRVVDEDDRPVPQHHDRDLAGQRRRSLRPSGRPARCADGSEFPWRRAGVFRCRWLVSVHHHQAGRLSRGATTTMPGGRTTSITRCSAPASGSGSSPRCISPAIRCWRWIRSICRFRTRRRGSGWSPAFDIDITAPEWALGYRFDFVLRGRNATPTEQADDAGGDGKPDDRSVLAPDRGSKPGPT